jgi:hypothetical protein
MEFSPITIQERKGRAQHLDISLPTLATSFLNLRPDLEGKEENLPFRPQKAVVYPVRQSDGT